MSKIMKYKYFSNGDIFDATSKAVDSWIWKSWNESNALLKKEYSWQVGNEGRIKVWEDIWLKGKFWRKVSSTKPEACNVKNVKELMNQERRGWNVTMLKQLFREEDVRDRQRTPISLMESSDRLAWNNSRNGQYIASSRYQLAKVIQLRAKRDKGSSVR